MQLELFKEQHFDSVFRFRCVGRVKGSFDIDGNIVKWFAYRIGNTTFLSLFGSSISETGYRSHTGIYDLDEGLRNNEHHNVFYQIIHLYYDSKCYRKNENKTLTNFIARLSGRYLGRLLQGE